VRHRVGRSPEYQAKVTSVLRQDNGPFSWRG